MTRFALSHTKKTMCYSPSISLLIVVLAVSSQSGWAARHEKDSNDIILDDLHNEVGTQGAERVVTASEHNTTLASFNLASKDVASGGIAQQRFSTGEKDYNCCSP